MAVREEFLCEVMTGDGSHPAVVEDLKNVVQLSRIDWQLALQVLLELSNCDGRGFVLGWLDGGEKGKKEGRVVVGKIGEVLLLPIQGNLGLK